MLRLTLCVLALVLLTACGKTPRTVDAELQRYFDRFESEVAEIGEVDGRFVDSMSGDVVGTCSNVEGRSTVSVLKSYWNTLPEGYRLDLVYHELGHCSLGLGHDSSIIIVLGQGREASIMNPYNFDADEPPCHLSTYARALSQKRAVTQTEANAECI